MARLYAECSTKQLVNKAGLTVSVQTMTPCSSIDNGKRILEFWKSRNPNHYLIPMSHPFVERLIGSVRRELLDQTFFWTATDLENKLGEYQQYYNECRCHSSRDGRSPVESIDEKAVDIGHYRWKKHCRGLFHLPIAA